MLMEEERSNRREGFIAGKLESAVMLQARALLFCIHFTDFERLDMSVRRLCILEERDRCDMDGTSKALVYWNTCMKSSFVCF
jgi:hypothetical protein